MTIRRSQMCLQRELYSCGHATNDDTLSTYTMINMLSTSLAASGSSEQSTTRAEEKERSALTFLSSFLS